MKMYATCSSSYIVCKKCGQFYHRDLGGPHAVYCRGKV